MCGSFKLDILLTMPAREPAFESGEALCPAQMYNVDSGITSAPSIYLCGASAFY